MTTIENPPVLRIELLHPTIGAVLHGVDARRALDESTVDVVRRAVVDHKVVVLRAQHLDHEELRRFALHFGDEWSHPILDDYPDYEWLLSQPGVPDRADNWHADATFVERPPFGTVLEVTELPPVGGDTLFVDLEAAYAGLAGPVRRLLDELTVVHDGTNFVRWAFGPSLSPERRVELFEAATREVEHPTVAVHPVSGRRSLYGIPGFARRIVGVSEEESDALLALVRSQITKAEHLFRHRWTVGDVVVWDNRTVLHRVADDYGDAPRRFLRVQLAERHDR